MFKKRKQQSQPKTDIGDAVKNPYLAARREWDERYGDLIARARNWRNVAMILACALVLAVGGLVLLSNQSRVVPYVVEIDSLGRQVGGGFAAQASVADDRMKRASLYRWVADLRSITGDGILQRQMIDRVYAGIAKGSPAQVQISEYYKADPPQKRAQTQIVTVDVAAVYPSTQNTYEVEWVETTRNLQGTVQNAQRWRGSVSLVISPPSDELLTRVNPLGIYVQEISWSKVLN